MARAITGNTPFRPLLIHLPAVLFFTAVFYYFYPPAEHGDIWTHLNGGRWIWENGGFPAEDPFAFTANPGNAERLSLLNRGYWLAQIAFYAIFKYFGFQGLHIFSAALFTLIFYVLWRVLRHQGLDPLIGFVVIMPCIMIGLHYNELRPRNFMFLFLPLIYYILEKGLSELREKTTHRPAMATFILLPVFIILWANLYRGFIILFAVLAAYLSGELLTHRFRERMPKIRLFVFWIILAMLSSLLNPNFTNSITLGFGDVSLTYDQFPIIELSRPWTYDAVTGSQSHFLYWLVLVTAAASTLMLSAWRRIRYHHLILFLSFALAGWLAFRFSFLFVLIAVVVCAKYLVIPDRYLGKLRPAAALLSVLFALFLFITSDRNINERRNFFFDSTVLPSDAVDYLVKEKPPQPIFNPYNWGGYISWRTYPHYKIFMDSRLFDPSICAEEVYAENRGTIKFLLDKYRMNTAIYYPIDRGQIKWIVLGLLKDEEWGLVYFDNKAAIFIRADSRPSSSLLNKQRVYDFLMLYAQLQINDDPAGNDGYANLAAVYRAMGKYREAEEIRRLGTATTGRRIR